MLPNETGDGPSTAICRSIARDKTRYIRVKSARFKLLNVVRTTGLGSQSVSCGSGFRI